MILHLKHLLMPSDQSNASERGFGAMDSKQQKDIASRSGNTAQENGTAHELTTEEARKGGMSSSSEKNDRQDIQRKGREDWGGYKGY